MASIFSKIIAGEVPCHKVWEDEGHLAFLDINPVAPGHTLVVPKLEIDQLFDMPEDAYGALMAAAKTVAEGLKQSTGCARVAMLVYGFEVPHAHVHLVPTNAITDLSFPARMTDAGDLAQAAASLRSAFGA